MADQLISNAQGKVIGGLDSTGTPAYFGGPPGTPGSSQSPAANSTPKSAGLTYTADPNQAAIDAANLSARQASGNVDANGNPLAAPDQNTVYNNTVKNFQTEIDALNNASAKARAQITAQYKPIEDNRVGQGTALNARRGLIGSDFGNATTDRINVANTQELTGAQQASDAKYQDQINALYGQARSLSESSYQAKLKAYTEGADATVNYLKGKSETAKNNASTLASQALSQGIDLTDPANSQQLKDLSAQLGVSTSELAQAYGIAKTAADKTKAENDKAAAELAQTYAQIAKTKGETLTPEQALAKANADIGKTVQETKTSAASAAASLASAANSYASAAKTKLETSQLGQPGAGTTITNANGQEVNIPNPLAPYAKTSFNGTNYIDLSALSPTDKNKFAQIAAQNGIKTILQPADSAKINAISDAKTNLQNIQQAADKIKLGTQDSIIQGTNNSVQKFFGNTDLKAYGAWRTAIINNVQALAGGVGSGLRINKAEIDAAMNNDLPVVTGPFADTVDSAKAKLDTLNKQLDVWEKQLVGGGNTKQNTSSANNSGSSFNGIILPN